MEESRYQRGIEQFSKMVGEPELDALRARLRESSPDFERLVMGVVGAEVWARPNLDLRTRSLCSLAVLAALGRVNALELNVRMAVRNGVTREEIVEAMLHVAAYAGFAAAWDALDRIARVLCDIDAAKAL